MANLSGLLLIFQLDAPGSLFTISRLLSDCTQFNLVSSILFCALDSARRLLAIVQSPVGANKPVDE
jgi:hypothetical protein